MGTTTPTTTTNTEDLGTSGRLTGDEGEGSGGVVEESDNVVIIVVAICLIVIVLGLSALFGLHYKRMLPQCFYSIFSARWKPVATDMDVEEEASEKPIIKNGNGLNVSMGDTAQINGDCTVVTYVGEKEEDDVKKELVEAAAEEEKEEKKDVEKKVVEEEEKKEEVKEEKEAEDAKETDPLKEESESK